MITRRETNAMLLAADVKAQKMLQDFLALHEGRAQEIDPQRMMEMMMQAQAQPQPQEVPGAEADLYSQVG